MIGVARREAIKNRHGLFWRLLGRCLLVMLALLSAAAATGAHGTHARILSPVEGEEVFGSVKLHVERPVRQFPYVGIEVRSGLDESIVWLGLAPLSKDGYSIEIDLKDWPPGRYVFEIKLLGDYVEQVQKRSFIVRSS